jgi:type IV secretory pathway TraG/TraD family ATPase VirD4
MSSTSRRSQGPITSPGSIVTLVVAVMAAIALGSIMGGGELAATLDHKRVPASPMKFVGDLVNGKVKWPAHATAIAAMIAGLTILLGLVIAFVTRRWWYIADGHADRAARWMGQGRQIAPLLKPAAAKKAEGFGVKAAGMVIAKAVSTGQLLYADFEAVCIDIWGPRTGKSTSRAIPSICRAPGAVIATSNKRDLVDATRELRSLRGDVFVFDPQSIADEPIGMWWNPLSYVRSETHAMEMADVFSSASREAGAKTDAFFDNAGQQLVADLLMAAAVGGRHLNQVYLWLSDQQDLEPVRILDGNGFSVFAADLRSKYKAADKERSGVFSTALGICAFMLNSQAMEWVLPPSMWRKLPGREIPAEIPEFDPYAFVRSCSEEGSGDTLYCLSKEGKAGAGPIVTALTVAVCEAAEDIARKQRGGRLAIPMIVVLDEAANVCRWRKLPDMYSHYGSRGILPDCILQSWSQGVEVWGREGMTKLWSASNVAVYGGGVRETAFLEDVSKLIGDFDLYSRSLTTGQGHTMQSSTHREKILDVSDLGRLPRGRAIVLASGAAPTLAQPIPWWELDKHTVELIRGSIAKHDPAAAQTLADVDAVIAGQLEGEERAA